MRVGALCAELFFVVLLVVVVEAAADEGLLLEIEEGVRAGAPTLNPPLPIVERLIKALDVPRDEPRFLFRRRIPLDVELIAVGVGAAREAHVGAEVARAPVGRALQEEMATRLLILRVVAQPVAVAIDEAALAELKLAPRQPQAIEVRVEFRIGEMIARGCADEVEREGGLRVELEAAVNARAVVVFVNKVVSGGDDADAV